MWIVTTATFVVQMSGNNTPIFLCQNATFVDSKSGPEPAYLSPKLLQEIL